MEPPPAVDESDDDTCVSPSPTPPPHSPCCSSPGVMVAWAGYERFKVGIMEPPPAADESDDDAYMELRSRWPLADPPSSPSHSATLFPLVPHSLPSRPIDCPSHSFIVGHQVELRPRWPLADPPPSPSLNSKQRRLFPPFPPPLPSLAMSLSPTGGAQTSLAPGRPSILLLTLSRSSSFLLSPTPILLIHHQVELRPRWPLADPPSSPSRSSKQKRLFPSLSSSSPSTPLLTSSSPPTTSPAHLSSSPYPPDSHVNAISVI
ncbi:unnamed protein product [Closterium sp. NIES-54]